jgi:rfaE bifunctional protein kinase chain/domain
MTPARFDRITAAYPGLGIAVAGDFCLDRYLEIDPARCERSIETGLVVHNVINTRAQAGAAGTILNNLSALGIGRLYPVGFAGEDGEGYELRRALAALPGVSLEYFLQTPDRRTFTYCKPLVLEQGRPPRELERLDSRNWTPTPAAVEAELCRALRDVEQKVDAVLVMDQVDLAGTGTVTAGLLGQLEGLIERRPGLLVLADSRRGLGGYPPVSMKMNRAELGLLLGEAAPGDIEQLCRAAGQLARRSGRYIFITLAEQGMVGCGPSGRPVHQPALPARGPIDIVGAGDAVSANLGAALAAGASLAEALWLASAAASIVIGQLGTTGTASVEQMMALLP